MTNREWFWIRALGEGGNKQNISRIAGNPLSVSAIRAPLLKKKNQNGRENGVCCHNLKARQQTQTKRRKINQKNRNKKNNNQDTNNRETRRPQMQETWVWKGGCDGTGLKGKQQSYSRKVERRKRIGQSQKKTQNGRSKGFDELQRKTTMVSPNRKGWENQKEEDQEQVKDLVRQNHPLGKPPFCQSLSVYNRDWY